MNNLHTREKAKRFRTKHRLVASRLFTCIILLYLVCGQSYWAAHAPILSSCLFLLGCVLGGAGAYGRVWALAHIAGRKRAELVTDGPYSVCRNPIYLSSSMLAIGFMLCAGSFVLTVVTACAFYALYAFVLSKEGRELEAVHGQEFVRYRETTPAFWPRFSGLRERESKTVLLPAFRRQIWAIALYLPMVGSVPLLRALHDARMLPSLYTIY